MKAPCYNCDRRAMGCHAKCSDYAAWSVARESEKARAAAETRAESIIIGGVLRAKKKAIKGKRH